MSRKERESRTPAQVAEQPVVEHEQAPEAQAAPDPAPATYPGISPSATIRLRAVLWRAALDIGQAHPARKHLEALADEVQRAAVSAFGQALAELTATLRQMHAKADVMQSLSEAADILAGRR